MQRLSHPLRFRRAAPALALIAAPLLLVVASAVGTYGGGDTADYVARVADNRSGETLAFVLTVLGFALLVPGVLGALALLRGPGAALGNLAASLAVLSLACFSAIASTSAFDVAAAEPGSDVADYVSLVERVEDNAGATAIVLIALVGSALAFILLAAALLRAGAVPWWAPAALVAGLVVVVAGGDSRLVSVIGNLLMAVGFGTVGLELLRRPEDEPAAAHSA